MSTIQERVAHYYPQMVAWRREFHQFPERSFYEIRTAQRVAEELSALGLQVRTQVGGRGVIASVQGKEDGPTIALRADMDALPIREGTEVSYRSQVDGLMHACGHDGHMAIMLATASILTEMKEELSGRVIFLFQHAEELIPGGAKQMIEDGALEGVDEVYGLHLWTPLPTGRIGYRTGAMMAAADSFQIDIKGKGGHGGLPHECVDAIAIASHLVVNLQSIISRQVDPLQSGVISVGQIAGGGAFNVIAESCRLSGTVRTFDEKLRRWIHQRIEQVVKKTCQMYGAEGKLEYEWGYPAVINHDEAVVRMARVGTQLFGEEAVEQMMPVMAAEDFSYYLQERKGAFVLVGAGNKEIACHYPHHHPCFNFDEEAMKVGAALLVQTALSAMQESPMKKAVREG
ncbi:M20 family metallopeptidase [Mechercharimyces sp. CAU 1602]|uniref:M20 metallopeptidase family protein n=1 Tax=Mechercharimyces sp. CAU 1602 TaxID=2973933 RepID=UPI002163E33C|nr:amidohydrolase [Mechercharimyces sp. CAU 1602]MCS1350148.1 amidohydrolase [Mechercharimyces sp. CAU 1602]